MKVPKRRLRPGFLRQLENGDAFPCFHVIEGRKMRACFYVVLG